MFQGHYLPESFLNPFNSNGESGEDFVWEIKSSSIQIQNSAWIGVVKKTDDDFEFNANKFSP